MNMNQNRLLACIMPLLFLTSALKANGAVYLSNLTNRWIDPGNPGVNDIGDIQGLDPGPLRYTFTANFTTGARSVILNSITLEFLVAVPELPSGSWTNIDVQLYETVGNRSLLVGAFGYPTINPMPTQWPQGSTGISAYTTYIDFHPMWQASLKPLSQYQVSVSDPTNSPSAAGLLFGVSPSYNALDNWQMGPTTGNVYGVGEFLKLAIDAATVEAQFAYTTNYNEITITGYAGSAGYIAIPGALNGLPVTGIGQGALSNCYDLASVTIAHSVTNIGIQAFASCPVLAYVYFEGNAPEAAPSDVFLGDTNATVYYLPGTTGWSATFAGRPAKLWNPQVQTGDAKFGLQNNQFGFNITGTADIPIVVEARTSLTDPVWSPVAALILSNGSIYFNDPQGGGPVISNSQLPPPRTNYPSRFYRIRSP